MDSLFRMSQSEQTLLAFVLISFCFTILYLKSPVFLPMNIPIDNTAFAISYTTGSTLMADSSTKDVRTEAISVIRIKEIKHYKDNELNIGNYIANLTKTGAGRMTKADESSQSRLPYNNGDKGPSYCGVSYSASMDLLSMEPIKQLPEFKNPCWFEDRVFRCFPYFFLIGFPKCGTTDIHNRIKQHPQYVPNNLKEYQWLSKTRFYKHITLQNYLQNFDQASNTILMHSRVKQKPSYQDTKNNLITGDSSATYIFDNDFWMLLPGNRNRTEPVYTNPHYIYHLYQKAKIIVSVRNPIERLWSDFLYQSTSRALMTANSFHEIVVKAIKLYQDCFNKRSILSCVYDRKLYILSTTNTNPSIIALDEWVCPQFFQTNVHLRLGLYSVFIKEYLEVFSRDQIHVVRLEDFSDNMKDNLQDIFDFLGLERLSDQNMDKITKMDRSNTKGPGKEAIGSMKDETRKLLYEFYEPFNEELARLLNDQRFNFGIR